MPAPPLLPPAVPSYFQTAPVEVGAAPGISVAGAYCIGAAGFWLRSAVCFDDHPLSFAQAAASTAEAQAPQQAPQASYAVPPPRYHAPPPPPPQSFWSSLPPLVWVGVGEWAGCMWASLWVWCGGGREGGVTGRRWWVGESPPHPTLPSDARCIHTTSGRLVSDRLATRHLRLPGAASIAWSPPPALRRSHAMSPPVPARPRRRHRAGQRAGQGGGAGEGWARQAAGGGNAEDDGGDDEAGHGGRRRRCGGGCFWRRCCCLGAAVSWWRW